MLTKIADTIMYICAGADVVCSVLYALSGHWWKALYWFSAAAIVFAVTKMLG